MAGEQTPNLARSGIEAYFGRLAKSYGEGEYFARRRATALSAVAAEIDAARSILDLGCGNGAYLRELVQIGEGKRIAGVDLSVEMLAEARRRVGARVGFAIADATALPFKADSWDFVLCSHVLQFVADLDRCVSGISRCLRAGGVLVATLEDSSIRKTLGAAMAPEQWEEFCARDFSREAGPARSPHGRCLPGCLRGRRPPARVPHRAILNHLARYRGMGAGALDAGGVGCRSREYGANSRATSRRSTDAPSHDEPLGAIAGRTQNNRHGGRRYEHGGRGYEKGATILIRGTGFQPVGFISSQSFDKRATKLIANVQRRSRNSLMPTKYVEVCGYATWYCYAGATTLPDVTPDFSRGRTMIFVHAAGSNSHTWHNQLDFFGAAQSPIALDLPGHGRSAGVEGLESVRDYADFLAAFTDQLKIKSAVIAGRSMGGAVAMDFALRYPGRVEALILIATAARFSIAADRIEGLRAVTMGRAPQAFVTDGYSPKTISGNFDAVREGWMEQIKTDPRVRYTDVKACAAVDLRDQIGQIDEPVLILAGADDQVTTVADAELIKSRIKGARLEVIADAAHNVPTERPAEVNSAIGKFLAELR